MPSPELPLVARARQHVDHMAIVTAEGTFTYRDLLEASSRVAACLLDGRADLGEARVAFLAPAGWPYVATQWGIWRAGGVAVPLATSHPPAELEHVIRDVEPEIVVAHPDFAETMRSLDAVKRVRLLRTDEALAHPRHPAPGTWAEVAEGRRAMIVYTSGTTGKPKGVVTTHANLRAQVTSLITAWEWTADDAILLVLPLHPVRGERRPGFVGRSLPGVEARLVDEQGGAVAPGTPGELEVRGPGVFLEYWRRPEATTAAFRDGWFRSGDVAVVEDGAYRLLGRSSVDIIKSGGYKISALEIEAVLRTHPAVAECAVVGVEDPEWGEKICAAVEPRGAEPTLAELQAWARERLAPYKLPRALRYVAALPRNAMGKVMKPEVAALFGARST